MSSLNNFLNKIPVPGRTQNEYSQVPQNDRGLPQPVTTSNRSSFRSKIGKLNPFKRSKGISLDSEEVVTSDPGMFELSKWDRMLIFAITFAGALSCYLICIMLFPILSLKPRKFAILWSLGSLLFLVSFGVLQGPIQYLNHLFSSTRILFTITFVSSIILTLIFSLAMRNTLLTILAAICQLIAAAWYTVSYFPLGTQSLSLATNVASSQVDGWINS